MSRIRNADQSLLRFRRAWGDYETRYRPRIDKERATYVDSPTRHVPPATDESLEIHAREYLINALLYALNWRLDCSLEEGLPNLMPEAPLTSGERRTRRFLDYLGLETDTDRPLLIVEAKRPKSSLPQRTEPSPGDGLSFIICDGIRGTDLTGEWNKWLETLRDYVRSVKEQTGCTPQRVVITNSDWLILFVAPANAFLAGSDPDPTKVLIWESREDIENRYAELFQWLEHYSVLGKVPSLTVGELPFYVEPNAVNRAMHGLRLLYIEEPGFYELSPVIKVLPVLFLHSRYGAWLYVEASNENEHKLPHRYDKLTDHLDAVRTSAEHLLQEVNASLDMVLAASPLADHYYDYESFADLCGVTEVNARSNDRSTEYLIVTGANTHFFLPEPSIPECPYHDWVESKKKGVESNPGPVMTRCVHNPRSFFMSGEPHHCAHREVTTAKASPITLDNRDRCGPRSGRIGQAFCEIARFEEHLCCRACVFEEVCVRAQAFHLPCEQSLVETVAQLEMTK